MMLYVAFGLILLGPFFHQLLPAVVSPLAIAAGGYLFVLGLLLNRAWISVRWPAQWMWWIVLSVGILVSQYTSVGYDGWSSLALASGAVLLVFATTGDRWIRPLFAVMTAYSSVHVFATIFLYLVPSVYASQVKPRFFADNTSAVGYQSALTSHYSYNAMYCVIAALIGVAVFLGSDKRWHRFYGAGIALSGAFAVILTGKRAHILLTLLAIFVVVAISHLRGRGLKIAIGAFAVVLSAFVASVLSPGIAASVDRVLGTFETTDVAELTSGRTLLWNAALAGWQEKPLLGHGWGSFEYLWPGGTQSSYHAHNAVLNALYEVGIVGTAVFVIAVMYSLRLAFRAVSIAKNTTLVRIRVSGYFCVMTQVFLVIYAFTSGELLTSAYTIAPYLVAIALSVHINRRCDEFITAGAERRSSKYVDSELSSREDADRSARVHA